MPRSVMIAVTYLAGVTSKAGFSMDTPSGVICFPAMCVTSLGLRCSMGILLPSGQAKSMVEIGGDAVGSDDDGSDLALPHHRAGHVVGDHGGRNAIFHQLPRSKPRTLQEWTSFVGEDVNLLALLNRGTNHAERGAIARRSQRSGVAVSEHSPFAGHERGAV